MVKESAVPNDRYSVSMERLIGEHIPFKKPYELVQISRFADSGVRDLVSILEGSFSKKEEFAQGSEIPHCCHNI